MRKNEIAQVGLVNDHVANELHIRDRVNVAFVDIDRDIDVLFVRRYRYLGRLDFEVGIASVHVEGSQRLEVTFEGFLGVTIVLAEPREPVRRVEFEILANLVLVERLVAHDVYLSDLRAITLVDIDLDANRVVRPVLDLRFDDDAVFATVVVLLAQEHLNVVQHRAVERAAAGKTDAAQ